MTVAAVLTSMTCQDSLVVEHPLVCMSNLDDHLDSGSGALPP